MSITSIYRDWSYPPALVRIVASNTLAEVGTTGYLLTQADEIAAFSAGTTKACGFIGARRVR